MAHINLTGASTLQLNTGTVHNVTLTNSSTGTIDIASGFNNYLGGTINNSAGGTITLANNSGLYLMPGPIRKSETCS